MARKIRFPLKMTNGTEVRTIDELRADFDLTAVLGYYADGKLVTWLRDRYLDSEADKVEALDKDSKSFQNDLCAALGVEAPSNPDEAGGEFDMDYINRRNEKKRILRTITDDEEIIYKVDQVALNQDDLLDIYDEGKKEIYLCQGEFEIPLSVTDVTYIGVADPIVTVRVTDNVNFKEKNIKFVDCVYGWDISNTTPLDEARKAENLFLKGDYKKAIGILEKYAEMENPRAKVLLYFIYYFYFTSRGEQRGLSLEICGMVENINSKNYNLEKSERYLYLLKKLADKGDWLSEYYYADLLCKNVSYGGKQYYNVGEIIRYYGASAEKGNFGATLKLIQIYNNGAYGVNEDKAKALKMLSEYAEKGEVLAQMELADWYKFSFYGVEEDHTKSAEWYTKAAAKGVPKAQHELGYRYENGWYDMEKDEAKAVEWYKKAAEQGDVGTFLRLGDLYYYGKGVAQNYEEAIKWYSKILTTKGRRHNLTAQYRLGECYYYGYGVPKNYTKAVEYFSNSAKDEYVPAQYMLGNAYYDGNGVEKNRVKAVEWYTKAANNSNGSGDAYGKLSECYYYGEGVKSDYEQAFKWVMKNPYSSKNKIKYEKIFESFKEAAEAGNADKQHYLGDCYYEGIGTERDTVKAVEWYTKAAERGNAEAQYKLGDCYLFGVGVLGSIYKAIELYKKSAENGYVRAQTDLGDLYSNDARDYVENDYEEALKWYTMAAEHGANVEYEIEDIKRKMNEEVTS